LRDGLVSVIEWRNRDRSRTLVDATQA